MFYKTDGTTAGTVLVKDIWPGHFSSAPNYMEALGNEVFFRASTAANGSELWKSDGTATGTVLVKDLVPGTAGSHPAYMQRPDWTALATPATTERASRQTHRKAPQSR